ncbi:MAG: flagellar hook-length control protein, partial [Actinomycetia bacterium]|nr:flagellar hook-length control protein [Actinomycetes bacterium]
MTTTQDVIASAMSVARDAAEGRLDPANLEAAAVEECRALVGTVTGPDNPLWGLQVEIARGV